ncbi:hypothetical protein LUZ63_007204 [Rhynchospora breviuscula]|uniref:Lipoxygenase n=1 Tax=Rhynchospora breviuscula TaxID=2022672 RepID=A0A9Q0CS09_9POAL|nr:hypothetical protein LUZ63_007204 [Rhynchospora breviuscula]
MAAALETTCTSPFHKYPSIRSHNQKPLCFRPFVHPLKQSRSAFVRRGRTMVVLSTALTEKVSRVHRNREEEMGTEKVERVFKVRADVIVRRSEREGVGEKIGNQVDALWEMIGNKIVLELIGTEINPGTNHPKISKPAELKNWFQKNNRNANKVVCAVEFSVDSAFGEPGAIAVTNKHRNEFFLESVIIRKWPIRETGHVHFSCNSWVQPVRIQPNKRVFFTNKPYLPSETPPGLRKLRDEEMKELRGNGKGERRLTDRIYDYATYNDLGNPEKGPEFIRPLLGGNRLPFPRRLRTGRAFSAIEPFTETRVEDPLPMYVPRDEAFEEGKQEMLVSGAHKALLHNLFPCLVASFSGEIRDFKGFHEIDNLFKEGIRLKQALHDHLLPKIPGLSKVLESGDELFRFDTPHILTKDKLAWQRDDEFARQTLAGINPVNIERLRSFPLRSKLDPSIYGPPKSAIKEEHIIGQLDGMSVQQAMEKNKLYILDHHDTYIPFIDAINSQDGRKAYGTRTIFFLTTIGTLKPIAIELSLPPAAPKCTRAKRVFTPPTDATTTWLWQLAKAHVCSNDAGVHQLVNHFLRTHATVEPFIISTHRQLSAMHPIFKLLKPHMRYTLPVNALARQILINAGGIIESGFTAGKYGLEISSAYYQNHWRFDQEGLPADLIRRGMAIEDSTQPHGLRLLIEDYPYASDGLLLWSAIQKWVHSYVYFYYPTDHQVQSDPELQVWYNEAVYVGHADVSGAPSWPRLATPSDLASILTTLIWLASAQHAALNFGQYPLGGYIPNRPPLMRRLVPFEGDPEYEAFKADPHQYYLSALPSLTQVTTFLTVIDTLSTHSKDEEYLGKRDGGWSGDAEIEMAFKEFISEIRQAEKEIERRNADSMLRNRCGAGVLPYELMAPSSGPGITCRGVPNSVSI